MTHDSLGAFVPDSDVKLAGAFQGPLQGLSFAAKDIFDIAGHVTGCGNPDWARTHEPAESMAPAVQALLDAGANLAGKTITDEFAYSLNGQNFHYGSPVNSNAPGRITGGSSSGSASAVAGGIVDLALGSDTGGSIRIPASYCGLYGLRPSHGRVPLDGVMPLAPSFDTVGWFARDAGILCRVGEVLLGEASAEAPAPQKLLLAEDAFAMVEEGVEAALAPAIEKLESIVGPAARISISTEGNSLLDWMGRFRTIQAREFRQAQGDWLDSVQPKIGPEIAERFDWVRSVKESDAATARLLRVEFSQRMDKLLDGGAFLCLPTAPGIAPLLNDSAKALRDHRTRVLSLTCIAGLAKLPQISMPLAQVQGCPVGLSLIGARGSDISLLAFAEKNFNL